MKKKITAALITFFAVILVCSLMAFALVAVNAVPYINSDKKHESESNYVTFAATITTFDIYDDGYAFCFEHGNDKLGNYYQLVDQNLALAQSAGLQEAIEANTDDSGNISGTVTVIATSDFIGNSLYRTIVALSYDGTEYLSLQDGKANLLADLRTRSANAARITTIVGAILAGSAIGLAASYLYSKKAHVFEVKN